MIMSIIRCRTGKVKKEEMKVYRYIHKGLLTALLFGWSCLLTDCTDHAETEWDRPDGETGKALHVASLTRDGGEAAVDPLKNIPIKLFLVQQNNTSRTGVVKKNDSGDIIWDGDALLVKPGADYHIFGFLPSSLPTSSSVSVAGNTATMTLNGLPTVTDQDFYVVTGVKKGLQTVTQGAFAYHAPEDTDEDYQVSLLADHLYAAVEFRIHVDAEYNKLRTIKLKQLILKCKDKQKASVNAVITLTMNDAGTHPIVTNPESPNPAYTSVSADAERTVTFYEKTRADAVPLPVSVDDAIRATGYFAEGYTSDLSIVSVYDVYDKVNNKNELIGERSAENNLSALLAGVPRGRKKVVTMTIDPTYMYILSDNDLNNPTVKIQ